MDMLMIDVTDSARLCAGGAGDVDSDGDGPEEITVDDLARWAGTVSYEILCGISKRVPRVLRDAAVTLSPGPTRPPTSGP